MDASYLHDFRGGDRLLVGDYGQGFQRRQGKLQWGLEALDELADGVVVLRLGGHLVSACDFPDCQPVFGLVELRHHQVEERLDPFARLAQGCGDLCHCERLLGNVDNRLQDRPELRLFHLKWRLGLFGF